MSTATMLRRLSTRTVGFGTMNAIKVADLLEEDGQPRDGVTRLYTAFGTVTGSREGTTDMGEWTALTGQFAAVNRYGEEFGAPQLFLPEPLAGMLYAQAVQLEPGRSIEIGVQVAVKLSEESPVGFEYVSQLMTDPEVEDPIAAMKAKWQHALPSPMQRQLTANGEGKEPAKGRRRAAGGGR